MYYTCTIKSDIVIYVLYMTFVVHNTRSSNVYGIHYIRNVHYIIQLNLTVLIYIYISRKILLII